VSSDLYDKAIKRLQEERGRNPYLQPAKAQTGALSQRFNTINQGLQTSLRANSSVGARVQASQNVGEQQQRAIGNVYDQASDKYKDRDLKISGQIEELEFKKDIAKEQEKKQADAGKANMWKMGGTLLGGAVGLATGTGFAGASIGAKIGSGIGGGIGSFQGGEFNSEMAMEGLTDAISGFSDYSSLQVENDLSNSWKNFSSNDNFEGLSPTDLQKVLLSTKGMNASDVSGYLNKYWDQTQPDVKQESYLIPTEDEKNKYLSMYYND